MRRSTWVGGRLTFGITVIILALALEVFARCVLVARSSDLIRLPGYANLARQLVHCPRSIAIVGNSTAEVAVDTEIIQNAFRARGLPPPCIEVFATDGSGMTTWRAVLDRYFWSAGLLPGTVVLLGAAYSFGDEGQTLDVGRVARFLGNGRMSAGVSLDSLLTAAQRVDYAISSVSVAFALRHRIARHLWGSDASAVGAEVIPTGAPFAGRPTRQVPTSLRALTEVISDASERHVPLLFVATPLRDERIAVPPAVLAAAKLGKVGFIDLQEADNLRTGDFVDPLHLGETGRAAFSRTLAESLVAHATERRAGHD